MIPLAVSEVITAITAGRNTKFVLNLGRGVKGSSPSLALTMASASLHKVSLLAPGRQELPRVARSRSIQTSTLLLSRLTVLTQPQPPTNLLSPLATPFASKRIHPENGACLRGLSPGTTGKQGRSA